MSHYIINRPTPQALERLLTAHGFDPVGRILRLALWAGLMRKEIVALQWCDVHSDYIAVDNRRVPLTPQLADYLAQCPGGYQPYVVVSSRNQTAISAQSASHLVRQVLDDEGERLVRLADLRSEYIINALQTTPWEQVCQQTGMAYTALRENFGAYLPEKISLLTQPKEVSVIHSGQMEDILAQHTDPAITLAMALAWHMGVSLQEMLPLTWGDFHGNTVRLETRTVPIHPWVGAYIQSLPAKSPEKRVLVGPKSGNPLLPERISRQVRQVMLRQGIHHVTLRDLVADYAQRQNGSDAMVAHLQLHGKATTAQLSALLGQESTAVYKQLTRLVKQGQVVKVGALYYHPTAVIPPQQHRQVIEGHVKQFGRLYRKDVVDLLGITPNQASILLKKWTTEGWLVQEKQSYIGA